MISEETRNKWDEKINLCIEFQDYLSEWELGFIDSLSARRDDGLDLTHKQSKKLNEIFDKVMEKVN